MKPEEVLQEFVKTLNELKVLMSSFSPDTKFAELVRQSMMKVHQDSEMSKQLTTAVWLLWAILAVVIFGFIFSFLFVGYLAE